MSSLLNKVKLAAHARGLVFVNVGTAHCKAIAGKTPAQLNDLASEEVNETAKKRWKFRAHAKEVLDKFSSGQPSAQAYCGKSIPLNYKKKLFLKEKGLWRSDSAICLAYQINNETLTSECVGVATFGAVDPDGFHAKFTNNLIQNKIENEPLVEIDLICVKPDSLKGTGTLLMLYVLAKELSRKSRGGLRYRGALLNLAQERNGRKPLENIATRLGFVAAHIPPDREGPYLYRILHSNNDVRERLVQALPDLTNILKVCPIAPRSGTSYCV